MPASRFPRVAIVGAGAVGSSIGRALHECGYPVVSVISRTGRDAVSLAREVKCRRASTEIGDLPAEAEILLLTVPDGSIAEVAVQVSKLKSLKFAGLFAAHCSGVHSADILRPLRRRGTLVASMHPIQTFPGRASRSGRRAGFRGIYFGIEGEEEALKRAQRGVSDLGGRALVIAKELKPLYHAACVFASNYMMVQLNAISELTGRIGTRVPWHELFGPLMAATIENAVRTSPAASLTGPVIRGDFSTVDLHLDALSAYAPEFLPLYISTGMEVARVGRERESISPKEFSQLIGRFRKFLKGRTLKNPRKETR